MEERRIVESTNVDQLYSPKISRCYASMIQNTHCHPLVIPGIPIRVIPPSSASTSTYRILSPLNLPTISAP